LKPRSGKRTRRRYYGRRKARQRSEDEDFDPSKELAKRNGNVSSTVS